MELDRGTNVLQHRATSLDLILQARAMRRQWLVALCARLAAKLGWRATKFIAQADRTRRPAVPDGVRLFGRPA